MAVTDNAAANQRSILEQLYRHSLWLAGNIRKLGAGDLSEDIVQETYLRVAKSAADQPIEHPRAFLLKIARNLWFDHQRKSVREAVGLAAVAQQRPSIEGFGDSQFDAILLE